MKRIIILIAILAFILNNFWIIPNLQAQRRPHISKAKSGYRTSYRKSGRTYKTKSYIKSKKSSSAKVYSKISRSRHQISYSPSAQTYKTTGNPKNKRSSSERREFLKSKGYSKNPKGYEVDHIIPLYKGGRDTKENMQLLTKEQHKIKTANDKRR